MNATTTRKGFTTEQAIAVADLMQVDLVAERIGIEALRRGMDVELEHGCRDRRTDVTHDDPVLTGMIALAHLRELPDYYDRLEEMEHRAATDEIELSHIWLRFEHQFEDVRERVVTLPEAGRGDE